jgi:replicative DNA helicase
MELSSPESEQMVLASMFSNEQAFCYGIENLESIDFTVEDYQIIFISFKTIYKSSNSMAMDKIIVELQEKKMLDKIGGLTALVAIVNVPRLVGFDDFVYYFKIVKNKSTYRKIVATLFNLSNSVKSADGDNPSEFLETCRKELFKINDSQHGELGIDLKKESEEKSAPLLKLKMQDKREGKIVLSAISTGIAGLDKFVGGWGKGQLITIAARTGIGKTALALNSALSLARSGFPIYFFSLEMSYEELRTRIWSQMTRISSEKIKSADLTDEEFVCLQNELSRLNSGCLIINDKTFMKINDVVSKARRCEKQFGISAVFIDYLQLIKSTSATEHRYLEIAEMTIASISQTSKKVGLSKKIATL